MNKILAILLVSLSTFETVSSFSVTGNIAKGQLREILGDAGIKNIQPMKPAAIISSGKAFVQNHCAGTSTDMGKVVARLAFATYLQYATEFPSKAQQCAAIKRFVCAKAYLISSHFPEGKRMNKLTKHWFDNFAYDPAVYFRYCQVNPNGNAEIVKKSQ